MPQDPNSPVQKYGNGFFQPGVMTIDPTPAALKPMQDMIAKMFMARMMGQAPQGSVPTFGQIPNVFSQLYGTNPFSPSTSVAPPGGGLPPAPPPSGMPPLIPQNPRPPFMPPGGGMPTPQLPPFANSPMMGGTGGPSGIPTFGDVVSGSRLIRSMQPGFGNQQLAPWLRRRP